MSNRRCAVCGSDNICVRYNDESKILRCFCQSCQYRFDEEPGAWREVATMDNGIVRAVAEIKQRDK